MIIIYHVFVSVFNDQTLYRKIVQTEIQLILSCYETDLLMQYYLSLSLSLYIYIYIYIRYSTNQPTHARYWDVIQSRFILYWKQAS